MKNIVITILAVLVLGLGGYLIYDKVLNNNEKCKEENGKNNAQPTETANETVALKYNYDLSKRNNIQAVRKGYVEVLVDTEGNSYLYIIGNLESLEDTQVKTNLESVNKKFKTYSPKGFDKYGSKDLEAYKLNITDVLTAHYIEMGNSGKGYFVFIRENGKVSYLDYEKLIYNGEISLKDINNLENIVSIVENTYSMTPYAIDLKGQEISLYDYIK